MSTSWLNQSFEPFFETGPAPANSAAGPKFHALGESAEEKQGILDFLRNHLL